MAYRETPSVFVISSSNGQKEAKFVAKSLAEPGTLDVRIWRTEFRPTELYQGTLFRATLQFDFAIAIITPDDLMRVSRPNETGKQRYAPRDNVIFELGLFHAALGRRHVLPVVVTRDGNRPEMPTDLAGTSFFSVSIDSRRPEPPLRRVVQQLRHHIFLHFPTAFDGLFASTALAIGYFDNFLQPVANQLNALSHYTVMKRGASGRLTENRFRSWKIDICIPQDLSRATRSDWLEKANELGLETAEVRSGPGVIRAYRYHIRPSGRSGQLRIADCPTTLSTIGSTVSRIMRDERREDRRMATERSVSDFTHAVLQMSEEAGFSNRIRITRWDEL